MRLIQITLPDVKTPDIISILRHYDPNLIRVENPGPIDMLIVNVQDEKVDEIIHILKEEGIDKEGTISVTPVMTSTVSKGESTVAPVTELIHTAERDSTPDSGFLYMLLASGFVATLGLLGNSTAIVIGAMVIAPLLSPSIAMCLGTVVGKSSLFKRGLLTTTFGILMIIVISFITALLIFSFHMLPLEDPTTPEIKERLTINVLSVGLALASGAAGAYSFAKGQGQSLVGVMIAVALVPPASVVGIGLALPRGDYILNAGTLLLVNVISLNLAGTLVFWRLRIRPPTFYETIITKKRVDRSLQITGLLTVLLVTGLAFSSYSNYQDFQLKNDIEDKAVGLAEGYSGNISEAHVTELHLGDTVRLKLTVEKCGNVPEGLGEYLKVHLEKEFNREFEVTVYYQTMEEV